MSTDPALNTLLTSIRVLLLTIGSAMAANGLASSGWYFWTQIVAGSVVTVGTAIWAVWNSWVNFRRARAQGVSAGIALTASGQAVTDAGQVISRFGADVAATPPKQVTLASSDEIIKNFGPSASSIAKS